MDNAQLAAIKAYLKGMVNEPLAWDSCLGHGCTNSNWSYCRIKGKKDNQLPLKERNYNNGVNFSLDTVAMEPYIIYKDVIGAYQGKIKDAEVEGVSIKLAENQYLNLEFVRFKEDGSSDFDEAFAAEEEDEGDDLL